MTKAMPFLQKYDITFLRPPTITGGSFRLLLEKTEENRSWDSGQSKSRKACG